MDVIGAGVLVALHFFARPGVDLEGDARLGRDVLDGANILFVEIDLALAMQRLRDGTAAEHKILPGADLLCVAGDVLAYLDHVGHRLDRGVQGKVARQLHLARVLVDIAEFTLFLGAPVLAVAKDRNEGAEGDNLMIRRPVGQVLEIVIRRFGNPHMRHHLPIHGQDEPAIDHVDEIR